MYRDGLLCRYLSYTVRQWNKEHLLFESCFGKNSNSAALAKLIHTLHTENTDPHFLRNCSHIDHYLEKIS